MHSFDFAIKLINSPRAPPLPLAIARYTGSFVMSAIVQNKIQSIRRRHEIHLTIYLNTRWFPPFCFQTKPFLFKKRFDHGWTVHWKLHNVVSYQGAVLNNCEFTIAYFLNRYYKTTLLEHTRRPLFLKVFKTMLTWRFVLT